MIVLTSYPPCQFCGELAPHIVERRGDGKIYHVCTACLRMIRMESGPFIWVKEK